MRFLFPIAALLLTGCRQDPPLDRIEILRVVQNEAGFQAPLAVTIPRVVEAGCGQAPSTAKGWAKLLAARVIELSTVRSGCEAVLTAETRQILGVRTSTPLTPELEIPVARRNIVSVDNEYSSGGSVDITFTWNWDPNEIGRRVGLPSKFFRGRAELQIVRDIWTAVRVDVDETPDPLQ